VELIDTQDNTQLWGGQYERELAEILDVKQEIAQEISEKLRLQLSGEEQAQLAKQGTTNREAYQDYLRGRFHSNKRSPEELEIGFEYFSKAIEKDPNYAQAYAGLADSYFLQSLFGGRPSSEIYQPALSAAQKALDLDDTLAEAHSAMGRLRNYDWDWAASKEHLTRAIELNPNYGDALVTYGNHLARQGQLSEGIALMKKAIEVDPLASGYISQLGRLLTFNRQYDEAIERLQEALEINPNGLGVRRNLVFAYWHNGMYQEAIAGQEAIDSLLGNPDSRMTTLYREVASGNRVDAMRMLKNWEGSAPTGLLGDAASIVKVIWYARLGEKDLAIEWATRAADEREFALTYAKVDPFFDPLRDDPRFQDLLRRMNLQP